MLVVNLFGAPGAGKSAVACGLLEKLKIAGVNCEISFEYAKRLVWYGRDKELLNQSYVTDKQHHKIYMLDKQVDVIVTDAPLPMGLVYAPDSPRWYSEMVWDFYHRTTNVNYYLQRVNKYAEEGRQQTEEDSVKIGESILVMLNDNDLEYTTFETNDTLDTPSKQLTSRKILDHMIDGGKLKGLL